jgi:F-type H+-transporting ATPase subunit delta
MALILSVVVLLVFGVGVVVLWTRGVFARDLTQALKRVTQQEQALQEKADVLEQRLAQMEREYQAKLKRAEAESDRLLQDAKAQALNVRTVAIDEAKHRARALLLEAEQGKTQLKAELAKELAGQAAQQACEALRLLLSRTELSSLHHTLVAEWLASLPKMSVEAIRPQVQRVQVTTALPLEPSEQERLVRWVAAAFGAHVPAEVTADPAMVAGVMAQMGPTTVDNSLRMRLNR